ncbi:MAG: UTRA domain-containing protein [Candidatus Microthrix sp.]|nr:UTRA domain-containing protein [Candidatus Microthrix sp.]
MAAYEVSRHTVREAVRRLSDYGLGDFSRTALYAELAERVGVQPCSGWERIHPELPTPDQRKALGIPGQAAGVCDRAGGLRARRRSPHRRASQHRARRQLRLRRPLGLPGSGHVWRHGGRGARSRVRRGLCERCSRLRPGVNSWGGRSDDLRQMPNIGDVASQHVVSEPQGCDDEVRGHHVVRS